jgi:hypothetical protein
MKTEKQKRAFQKVENTVFTLDYNELKDYANCLQSGEEFYFDSTTNKRNLIEFILDLEYNFISQSDDETLDVYLQY